MSGDLAWYYRYTGPDGERVRLPIGSGLDLATARREAEKLARRYMAGDRDLRSVLDAERREAERERTAILRAAEDEATIARATLGVLLTAYVAQLRRDGKASARDVETTVARHVENAWPKLWATPAVQVTTDDLLEVVARVVAAGRQREPAKLRSFLRAAFGAAVRARQDARALPELRALKITANPARDLATVEGSVRAGERALSIAEVRAYWSRIAELPSPVGPLLRFHLLTGGQRIEQLARLTGSDLDSDVQTVRLRDGKGRRKAPRLHEVPLVAAASEAVTAMAPQREGPFLFTTTAGKTAATHSTVRNALNAVVVNMVAAGELPGGRFTLGDLRRTVETRLAAEGISADIRAQLQSHGLGGVQARHYDRHDYLDEKRAALETLHRLVTEKAATVTTLRGRRKRSS
ncbi:MAG TPA: tyrosine-type recombinase/integrase [Lysobacter sp.]